MTLTVRRYFAAVHAVHQRHGAWLSAEDKTDWVRQELGLTPPQARRADIDLYLACENDRLPRILRGIDDDTEVALPATEPHEWRPGEYDAWLARGED